jgi:FKBP-type peptidyl-prolyl cis-trans isomerase
MRSLAALLLLVPAALGQQPAPVPSPAPTPAPPTAQASPSEPPQLVTPASVPGEKLPDGAEWKTTPSGLRYVQLAGGDEKAAPPTSTDRVILNYKAFLEDGKAFDSSKPKSPAKFVVNQVIKGWGEGLQLMHPGSRFKLHIPWQLAFGEQGRGTLVPGKTNLIIDVELVSVEVVPPVPKFSMPPDSELTTTASGLKWKQLRPGRPDGKKPAATDTVNVWYAGWLTDGTFFDGNYGTGNLMTRPMSIFVKGWQEALQLMQEGAVYQIVVPPGLGYGEQGRPPKIPPGATMVFQLELVRVGA